MAFRRNQVTRPESAGYLAWPDVRCDVDIEGH